MTKAGRIATLGLVAAAMAAPSAAHASFPYVPKLPAGANKGPNDLTDKRVWMYAATPEANNQPVNSQASELHGVRGASLVDNADVDTAWRTTTGRPDVTMAVLDSGIEWNNKDAMQDLRLKVRLNKGELKLPNHDRAAPLDGTKPCSEYTGDWDANGDGVFDVADYSCDSRVEKDPAARAARGQPRGVGPADLLDPQDVLIAFSDGKDDDHNGFTDDIAGWDFLDDDNDPFDDVQYGHGTGEARDSNAEADNGGDLGTCPNCTVLPLRVGDSFIADENRFAQAVLYAVHNHVLVVQEALGTIDHTSLASRAIDEAYRHGVTVIASAADEAAQHHNWPSNEAHTVVVNSVTKYDDTFTSTPKSYLQFNGCTNFSSKITVAIPSVSCSSDATGRASGMAGLIYSEALNQGLHLSANEVKQLMAMNADDVDFASAELSCEPVPTDACTDPNLNSVNPFRLVLPFPATVRYPARKGYDEFYGYGRVNMLRAVEAVRDGRIPPEASIDSPDWYSFVDPSKPSLDVRGHVGVRSGSYRCVLEAAPGSQPSGAADFAAVKSGWCDGSSRSGSGDGVLGSVDIAALKKRFPEDANDFTGREPGTGAGQTSNGRPNSEPYGFTVRVRVIQGSLTGEDRRNLYLHHDKDLLPGFPKTLPSDGEASPAFADLDGDNRNELIVATADGLVHAYKPDGSEAPGWPVSGDSQPLHTGGSWRGAFLASPAVADLNHDGSPEVVAADFEGRVYAWDAHGHRLWTRRTKAEYSGKPLSPFVDVRQGKRNRTQRGFIGSPVLADLDGDHRLEVVAAAMDRHVY
ncbi:MAG: S8 family serine peptidase, partial [Thermoleophilaceae bacterium]